MTFANCINDGLADGMIDKGRADEAMRLWRERRDRYTRQGYDAQTADALAAQDVKDAFKRQAGVERHSFMAKVAFVRRADAEIAQMPIEDLANVATSRVEFMEGRKGSSRSMVAQVNGLKRLFNARIGDLMKQHSRDLLGRNRDKAGLVNIARALHGEKTGDKVAEALAGAWRQAAADARRMFNEAGGVIGELSDWGLPHMHDAMSIAKAGRDAWKKEIQGRIAWDRIEGPDGKPMAAAGGMPAQAEMDRFLDDVFDNIAFGRDSDDPQYGRMGGKNLIRQQMQSRVMHFKSADDWIEYNRKFGTGDVYASMMNHLDNMAGDIVTLREFGPSPEVGIDYIRQKAIQRAREAGDAKLADRISGNAAHATKMLRLMRGGMRPQSMKAAQVARFFSTTRHVISSALLDRAIIASISDTNSMRMAAKAVGMNPRNVFSTHMKLLTDGTSRDDMLRAGWVADTLADPGATMARWQSEYPPSAVAERMSAFVMRAQGLAHWTDQARIAFQSEMGGLFAKNAGRKISEMDDPLRSILIARGVTEEDWHLFTRPEHLFTAGNGATFASPMWWRQTTDLAPERADEIYLKMQGIVEEQTEFAVPTQSYWARANVEGEAPPGTIAYEVQKSMLMVKSFAMTFTTNQIARTMARQGWKGRAAYGFDLAAGATVMGGVALLLSDVVSGRDPRDMTTGTFWTEALLKGGGFGVVGDLVSAGSSSWGGGLGSWATGPMPQLIGEAWKLSAVNAFEAATGDETDMGKETRKFLDRWTPGADLPPIGLAVDRMLWDSLQGLLDPEAEQAFRKAASDTRDRYGSPMWWAPGTPMPSRAPNPAAAIGG